MKHTFFIAIANLFFSTTVVAQIAKPIPCSDTEIMKRHLDENPQALTEREVSEQFIQNYIQQIHQEQRENRSHDSTAQYIIPVVLHVFHNGDDGYIELEDAQSGLDVLNADMQGLNIDWDDVDPAFEGVKAPLDVQFCLATIDPEATLQRE